LKSIEQQIEDQQLQDLQIESTQISFNELRKKFARLEARKALAECNSIAKAECLDKLTDEEINDMIKEVRVI
jgi:hypothetical protein